MPYRVTNTAKGPRFFHSTSGMVVLDPGQTWRGELDEKAGHLNPFERRKGEFNAVKISDADVKADEKLLSGEGVEPPKAPATPKFDEMPEEELRNWIKKSDPRGSIPANADRAALVKRATELSAPKEKK